MEQMNAAQQIRQALGIEASNVAAFRQRNWCNSKNASRVAAKA